MPISGGIRAGAALRFLLAGAALTLPLLLTTPARGEIIPAERMARGITMTPGQCAVQPFAVWVVVSNQGFCIRYYMSTAGGEGDVPVVFLQGDRMGSYQSRTRRFSKVNRDEDINTDALQRTAVRFSKLAKTTAIYLARVGVEGSSGFHGHRISWLELYVVNSALEAIKRRHGYRGFHLAGQSGGSGLIGGLLFLRADIVCAVPGAGRLALLDTNPGKGHWMLQRFDPIKYVSIIARRRGTRVLVVTDPQDQAVPARNQIAFVQAMRQAGGNIDQFYIQATDEKHHGVLIYTLTVVAGCARGMTNQQIMAELGQVQQRHLAAAQERRNRQAGHGQRYAGGPQQPGGGQQPGQPQQAGGAQAPRPAQPQGSPPPQVQRPPQAPQVQRPAPYPQPGQQTQRIQPPRTASGQGWPPSRL
jgi:hypothetical protein